MEGLSKTQRENVLRNAVAEIRALERKLLEEVIWEMTNRGQEELAREFPITGGSEIDRLTEDLQIGDLLDDALLELKEVELNPAEEDAAGRAVAAEQRWELENDR